MARPRNDQFVKDLFYFVRCDPGKGPLASIDSTPANADWKLKFEAHISNIHDASSPSWDTHFEMGRADPKVQYNSFNQSTSITFMVVAMNKEEHEENYKLLNKLGLLTYPKYSSGGLGFNGVHVFYAIGKLLRGYGVITNLDHDWSPETPWIVGRPLYTEVNISIMKLADSSGTRPNIEKSRYFN